MKAYKSVGHAFSNPSPRGFYLILDMDSAKASPSSGLFLKKNFAFSIIFETF